MIDVFSLIGAAAALCSTTSFAPQARKVIKTRDTRSISRTTYLLTVLAFALWTLYGILRVDWPLIVANAICLVLSCFILVMKMLPAGQKNRLADQFESRSD